MKYRLLVLLSLFVVSLGWSAGSAPQPASICNRACWGARAPKCSISQMPALTRAVVHHTAADSQFNCTSIEDSKANVRSIQNYDMDSRDYCDICYHFLVDKFGNIFEGRAGSLTSLPRGAHDGTNDNSFGFSLMGNFASGHQSPNTTIRYALYDLVAWRMPNGFSPYGGGTYAGRSGVGYICGHRNVLATDCPGNNMYQYIGDNINAGEMRDSVSQRINGKSCRDMGRKILFNTSTSKGYELDGLGSIHRINGAAAPSGTPVFSSDLANDFVVTNWTTPKGYVLDAWGGLHAWGGAPALSSSGYWSGWDICRAMELDPATLKGYKLDGFGGLWPINGAPNATGGSYWSGWDIARDLVITNYTNFQGYVLDGLGGVHPFNNAPAPTSGPYWTWDIARALKMNPSTLKGYVLDGFGAIHPVNGAPAPTSGPYFGFDIARDFVVTDWNTPKGYVLDGYGAWHPFGGAPAVTGAPYFYW